MSFSLEDLLRLPARTIPAFIECAGNGRSLFGSQQGTPAAGSAWKLGAIGVARWRGVPLREVLERAGLTAGAVDVMPEGLDATVVAGGVDQGHVRRPLPIAKALDDVLLAYEMNGAPLPPDHGFPVRLVVPGWIGIASIKWLGRIEVADRPLYSYWNTTQYRMTGPGYPADSPPLGAQPVKSAFELPWPAALPAGRHELHGRSWSGGRPIRTVQVRVGAGGAARPRAAARPEPAGELGPLDRPDRPAARGARAARPRDGPRRRHAARHRAVQHERLPVLGGRAPSGDRGLSRRLTARGRRADSAR